MAIRQLINKITGIQDIIDKLDKVAILSIENAGDGIQYANDKLKEIQDNPNQQTWHLADGTPITRAEAITLMTTERDKRIAFVNNINL